MTRWPAVFALALASVAVAAEDPDAPLAETKQQLQSLRKDDAAQKAGTPGGVKLDLPSLNTPESAPAAPSPRRDAHSEPEKERARRDWLLDGFNQLERRKPGHAGAAKDRPESEAEAKPLDPSDPDYFLRVYERQRAQAEAKQLDASASDAKLAASSAADPLASFMKEWLADSPVRDALKDSLPADRGPRDGSAEVVLPDVSRGTTAATGAVYDSSGTRGAPNANPFVQALGLPSLDPARAAEVRPAPVETALHPPATSPVPTTVYDLPERAKPDVKRALPPPPSDDKKYFPQLKKF